MNSRLKFAPDYYHNILSSLNYSSDLVLLEVIKKTLKMDGADNKDSSESVSVEK